MKNRRAVLELGAVATAHIVLAGRHTAMAAATDLSFRAIISDAGDALVVDYMVENTTTQSVFLTNKLWRLIDSKPQIDPNFVYGRVAGNNLLTLSKTMPEIPSGKSPTNLVSPYMLRLEPGQRFSETINLPLPVETYLEYTNNTAAKDENGRPMIVTVNEAMFALGYFLPPKGSRMWNERAFGKEVDLFHNPPGARAAYGVLSSPTVRFSIPVRKRATD
jgi:hypothetical protein